MPSILIAEDDLMIADMLEEFLVKHGYQVCGIARTVEEGIALGRLHKPDLALLDLRLADGGLSTEVAAALDRKNGLGILYSTGNKVHASLTSANGEACLGKPYSNTDLLRSLEIVREILNTGKASQPFPAGFEILKPASNDKGVLTPMANPLRSVAMTRAAPTFRNRL